MSKHSLDRDDINLDRLAAELAASAGKPVVLSTTPGELSITDEAGVPVELDAKVVEQILARHDPTPEPTPLEAMTVLLETDLPVEDKLTAVANWARTEVERARSTPPTLSKSADRPAREPGAERRGSR